MLKVKILAPSLWMLQQTFENKIVSTHEIGNHYFEDLDVEVHLLLLSKVQFVLTLSGGTPKKNIDVGCFIKWCQIFWNAKKLKI